MNALFKDTPVLVLDTVLKKTRELLVVLVLIAHPHTVGVICCSASGVTDTSLHRVSSFVDPCWSPFQSQCIKMNTYLMG